MKKVILLLLGMTLIYACGYHEGIIQKAERSYLKFVGNIENASIQIDNIEPFTIKATVASENGESNAAPDNKVYQLLPGKHFLKIYRNGNLVVDRILLLENQATMEVIIP